MGRRIIILVVAIAFLAGTASFARVTGIPDLEISFVTYPGDTCWVPVIFNVPNGTGAPFTEARDYNTWVDVDATLTLYLRDSNNDPVVNFPREDLWLEFAHPFDEYYCASGTIADSDTDASGVTQWVNPLFAGGGTEDGTVVMINGEPLIDPGFPAHIGIYHNSPDIDGNGIVNLSDLGFFAGDYFGGYSFRCDFYYDGAHNLADIARFAETMGAACP